MQFSHDQHLWAAAVVSITGSFISFPSSSYLPPPCNSLLFLSVLIYRVIYVLFLLPLTLPVIVVFERIKAFQQADALLKSVISSSFLCFSGVLLLPFSGFVRFLVGWFGFLFVYLGFLMNEAATRLGFNFCALL